MRLLITVLLLACSVLTYGQGLTSEGREFYLGHIHASHSDITPAFSYPQQRIFIVISSYQDNEVLLSYFNPQTGVETNPNKYYILANRSVQVLLDEIAMRSSEPGDKIEYRSCHIVAKHPVTVHYYRSGSCATGGYLALPVGTWGKQYVIASDPDNPGYGGYQHIDMSNGAFMVIAAVNGTSVTITPTARTGGGHVGVSQGTGATGSPQPYTVMLNRGQTYLVKGVSANSGNSDDMSGSLVKADKPVAVIMAHENANVGDGTVRESHASDARDFLIEQAIPWEFATHTGLISIPMQDSKGVLDGGYGEDVKLFVTDVGGASTITINGCGTGTPTNMGISPYVIPPVSMTNISQPQHFSCDSGKRFQAVQYELRSDGDGSPWTGPAMMNVVPFANWRNAYLWYVPSKPPDPVGAPAYEEYFVTVIAKGTVQVSVNGANADNPPNIDQALKSTVKKWCVAGLPDFSATTYKFSPGTTYYARSQSPFMVYVYGYVGTNEAPPSQDPLVNYTGFAYPAGMRGKMAGKANIGIKVEERCTSWEICAIDSTGEGIKSITLLNDPHRNFLDKNDPPTMFGGISKNCMLQGSTSLDGMEIARLLPEQQMCATIQITDSTEPAYAALAITDAQGNIKVAELLYAGRHLTTDAFSGFTNVRVGDSAVKSMVVRTDNVFKVEDIELENASAFGISYDRTLPFLLQKGDSFAVSVSFAPTDTLARNGMIRFSNECMTVTQNITGRGVTGLIAAEDKDFGSVGLTSNRCLKVRIENKGGSAFTLLPGFTLTGSPEFSIDSAERMRLPLTLNPGTFVQMEVCYQPEDENVDTAMIQWITDISDPYASSIKTTSKLTAKAVVQSVSSEEWPEITIRPNPSSGKFSLDLRSMTAEPVTVAVYNTIGVECYTTKVNGGALIDLQLPKLPAGSYLLRLSGDAEVDDLRLILH